MQHVGVACRQDPQTAAGRVAAYWLRRRIRLRPPGRNEYRVVRPAVRRFQSGTRPDSGHVACRARKPAPACRGGEGRTAARHQHPARAVPLATRLRIGARHILDAVLSFFQVATMCSCAAGTVPCHGPTQSASGVNLYRQQRRPFQMPKSARMAVLKAEPLGVLDVPRVGTVPHGAFEQDKRVIQKEPFRP